MAIVVLAMAGAAALYIAGPSDLIRNQLVARVKSQTGRDLVINGPTSFTVYPALGVNMADVSLSAPPGMTAPPLITVKNLTARVALMPLLKREVEVQQIILEDPVLSLHTDTSGRRSWDFAEVSEGPAQRIRLAQVTAPAAGGAPVSDAAPPAVPATAPRKLPLDQLALNDVRVVRGTVNYADQKTGASETLSAINMQIGLPNIAGTATLLGDLSWRNEKLDVDARLTSPKQLLDKAPVQVVANVAGRPVNARYDGAVTFADSLETDGDIALKGTSLKALLAFLGGKAAASARRRTPSPSTANCAREPTPTRSAASPRPSTRPRRPAISR